MLKSEPAGCDLSVGFGQHSEAPEDLEDRDEASRCACFGRLMLKKKVLDGHGLCSMARPKRETVLFHEAKEIGQ